MKAANNTFEETVALITAANSVVQDPDSVGTAFKTKFYRNCLYVQKCAQWNTFNTKQVKCKALHHNSGDNHTMMGRKQKQRKDDTWSKT